MKIEITEKKSPAEITARRIMDRMAADGDGRPVAHLSSLIDEIEKHDATRLGGPHLRAADVPAPGPRRDWLVEAMEAFAREGRRSTGER